MRSGTIMIIAVVAGALTICSGVEAAKSAPPPPADSTKPATCLESFTPQRKDYWQVSHDENRYVQSAIDKIHSIYGRKMRFIKKADVLQEAMYPYINRLTMKADDRALSVIRICFGETVEELCLQEARAIAASSCKRNNKVKEINALERCTSDIGMLADGFKSSIGVDLAFIKADITMAPDTSEH